MLSKLCTHVSGLFCRYRGSRLDRLAPFACFFWGCKVFGIPGVVVAQKLKIIAKSRRVGGFLRYFGSGSRSSVCLELQPLGQRNESKLQTLRLGVWKTSGNQRSTRWKSRKRSRRTSGFLDTRWATFCLVRSVQGRDTSFMSFDFGQLWGLHSNGVGFLCSSSCGGSFKGIVPL